MLPCAYRTALPAVAAAVIASTSDGAFYLPCSSGETVNNAHHRRQHADRWSCGKVSCDMADRETHHQNGESPTPTTTISKSHLYRLDPLLYQRMNLPDRASADSHVIYGALLSDNLVERYDAYRHLNDRTRVTAVVQLGRGVDGHPGVVHGGVLALLMDDVLGFGYEALGDVPMAVTANLNINYLQAVPAGACLLVQASLQRREGRKLYWHVRVVSSDDESVVFCEATSLFVIPRDSYEQASNVEASVLS